MYHIKQVFLLLCCVSTSIGAIPSFNYQHCLHQGIKDCVAALCNLPAQPGCQTQCQAVAKDKCVRMSKQLKLPGE